jgi:DNA replication and repair protein RecF
MLEEIDPTYGATLAEYERALRSRNRLLKMERPDRRSIVAYDPILASAGAVIGGARAELVREIAPLTERTFSAIAGAEVPLDVRYTPRVEPTEAAIADALARSLEKDLARGFTAEGPHADDVSLAVHARSAKHHASQGQQRTIVLALKVAELEVIGRRIGRVPPLLLDDVSSELDRTRSRRFFELLEGIGGQVWLTTTQPELIPLAGERTDWRIEGGRLLMG